MNPDYEITIRLLDDADLPAVRRIAERDSARTPELPMLGAESGGRMLAALALGREGSHAIADPFARTEPAVKLLELRARQLREGSAEDRGGWPLSALPHRAGRRAARASSAPGELGAHASSSGAIVSPAPASCSQ